jgi:hypothetical protein
LRLRLAGVSLEAHLRIVDALAMLFFLLVLNLVFFAPVSRTEKKDRGSVKESG